MGNDNDKPRDMAAEQLEIQRSIAKSFESIARALSTISLVADALDRARALPAIAQAITSMADAQRRNTDMAKDVVTKMQGVMASMGHETPEPIAPKKPPKKRTRRTT